MWSVTFVVPRIHTQRQVFNMNLVKLLLCTWMLGKELHNLLDKHSGYSPSGTWKQWQGKRWKFNRIILDRCKLFIRTTFVQYCRSATGKKFPGAWYPMLPQFWVDKRILLESGWKLTGKVWGPPDFAAAAMSNDCCWYSIVCLCWWIENGDTILGCKQSKY